MRILHGFPLRLSWQSRAPTDFIFIMRDEFLWVEKYRPKTIEDCILQENIKKTFQDFLHKGEVPNLLLDKFLQDVVRPLSQKHCVMNWE